MKAVNWQTYLKFFAVWLLLLLSAGVFQTLNKLPMSVHQGAQCDRASIAQNYYYNGFNFLYPEINENRCQDGIVSCELPLSAFLSAILYQAFGYDVFWFRFLSLLFAGAGLFALFLTLRRYIHEITALAIVLLMQFSPILLFYTANFLPDISSLGLVLVAWYLFVRLCFTHPFLPNTDSKHLVWVFPLVMGLGVASKTTSMIQWCTMMGVLLLSLVPAFHIQIVNRKKAFHLLFLSLILPVCWFFWSRHLAQTHNSEYFMMRVPFLGLQSYQEAWHVYLANWPQETFSRPLTYIIFPLLLLPLFLFKWIPKHWYASYFLNFFGSLAFVVLMMEQFKYHDYYIVCLMPVFAFALFCIALALNALPKNLWYIKLIAFVALLWAFNYQFHAGEHNFNERYTEGNYWEQSHVRAVDYDSFRMRLEKHSIDRNACVVVGFDNTPNNILYLLNLRGHRVYKDHNQERLEFIVKDSKPQYIISNDSAFTALMRPMVDSLIVIDQYKYLQLYRVKHLKK